MEGPWLKNIGNKVFSAAIGAPRLIAHVISGENIKDFKLFDDQSIVDSFKEQFQGQAFVTSLILGNELFDDPSELIIGLATALGIALIKPRKVVGISKPNQEIPRTQ